jgi:ketosteroid isomerase-like protein
MKPLIGMLALGASLWSFTACGESAPPAAAPPEAAVPAAPSDTGIEETIVQLERDWVAAIQKRDAVALERLLADDFVGTSPNSHIYLKSMAIDDLASGRYQVTSMTLDESSANVYGDTAVAFTRQTEISKYGDQDTSGHYHFTNVWLRRNGEWKVVASHGSRDDQPHDDAGTATRAPSTGGSMP